MIRLAVRVARADAEVVLAELLELAPSGVEEVDRGDAVEYAIYGAPGELPALPDVRAAVGGRLVEVVTTEVADDWPDRWREFHRPIDAGPFHVRPPWTQPVAGRLDLVIDPGQAFGTGAHATTHLSLELLAGIEPVGSLLDVGCGSGVLAIAAAKLGFGPITAVDHDPLAVEATLVNAAANGVALEDVRRADLRTDDLPPAPTVTANLLRPLLERLADRLQPPGRVIASGLLRTDAFAWPGLTEVERREEGDWAAIRLERRK